MRLCDTVLCTGCMACANVCAVNAISMLPDGEGFLRPSVNDQLCVKCGRCTSVCPQINPSERPVGSKKVYACWIRSKRLRKNSTSGGAFTALAKEVLQKGGSVFGAGFNENMVVCHKQIDSARDLCELRGSKYVQSDIGESFRQIKKCLRDGRLVLFSGTACQVDGLYRFLGSRYEGQLWTIDLVCHGVPSPMVYRDYLSYMQERYGASAIGVWFRNKEPGWYVFGMKIRFSNGREYKADTYRDPFIRGFLRELYLRPSCHQCSYAGVNRIADITLADFWGYHETCRADRDYDKGISMVMLNSTNGQSLFVSASRALHVWERPIEQAVRGNPALSCCFPPSERRADFWADYKHMCFDELVEKYLYPEPKENQYHPKIKEMHRMQDREFLHYLPQRLLRKILTDSLYERIKSHVKK